MGSDDTERTKLTPWQRLLIRMLRREAGQGLRLTTDARPGRCV